MRRYAFVLGGPAFFAFEKQKKTDREALIRLFLKLEDNPFLAPDFVHRSVDRDLSVLKCRNFLVYYWVDHAVCEVRIVDISVIQR